MDQQKIGKFISQCRKDKDLTQGQLAELLGVSDRAISKWERGLNLPDASLYKPLCEILDITFNELFAGEKIREENYKEVADNNLLNALENSVFTLKEKVEYFKNKWQKEHFFELMISMLVIVFFIIYGFIKDNDIQYLFIIIGFISGIIENNRMMAYIEKHAYGKQQNISVTEFHQYLESLKDFQQQMKPFASKKEAIQYLVKETGLSRKECSQAYDVIMQLDLEKLLG